MANVTNGAQFGDSTLDESLANLLIAIKATQARTAEQSSALRNVAEDQSGVVTYEAALRTARRNAAPINTSV